MKNRYLYFLILLACISPLFNGCKRRNEPPKRPAPNVTIAAVNKKEVPIYIDTIGQAISPQIVNVRPQVNGKLIKANIEQGAYVNEGDVIYEIDPRPYEAILDQAIAQLARDQALLLYAEQAVERNRKVVEEDFISKINFEQFQSNASAAQAQVEQDKAAITAARINVDFTKIVAPVSGKISYSNVDVGNIMIIDDPNQITVIRPFSPIDVLFSLPQQQFEMIRVEQGDDGQWPYVVTLADKPDVSFGGITYFIDNQIDQNTGTILLKGKLPNAEREMWPGEFVRVKVLYRIVPEALTVPPSSVLMGRDGPYLYVVDHEGKAKAVNVSVLTRTEEYIAIHSEQLNEGDRVIVDGQINVAPGIAVNEVSMNK